MHAKDDKLLQQEEAEESLARGAGATHSQASHHQNPYHNHHRDTPTEIRMKEGLLDVSEFERLNPDAVLPQSTLSNYTTRNQDAPTEVRMKQGLLQVNEFERLNPDAVYPSPTQSPTPVSNSAITPMEPHVPSMVTQPPPLCPSVVSSHQPTMIPNQSWASANPSNAAGWTTAPHLLTSTNTNGPPPLVTLSIRGSTAAPSSSKCCTIL